MDIFICVIKIEEGKLGEMVGEYVLGKVRRFFILGSIENEFYFLSFCFKLDCGVYWKVEKY